MILALALAFAAGAGAVASMLGYVLARRPERSLAAMWALFRSPDPEQSFREAAGLLLPQVAEERRATLLVEVWRALGKPVAGEVRTPAALELERDIYRDSWVAAIDAARAILSPPAGRYAYVLRPGEHIVVHGPVALARELDAALDELRQYRACAFTPPAGAGPQ